MFLVFIALTISVASGFFEKNRILNEKPAILFAESCSFKKEPKSNSKQLLLLHEGTKVFVLEKIAGWKKVELTDESVGWIDENAVRELN